MSNSSALDLVGAAEDLRYFESLVSDEANLIIDKINSAIAADSNPYGHLKLVVDVLASNHAQLSARVKILEQVLLGRIDPVKLSGASGGIDGEQPENVYALMDGFEVPVTTFAHKPNFYELEYTEGELAYAWTGPSPEIRFEVPVKRDTDKMFRLGFIAAVDEALLRDAQIVIDGQATPADVDFDGKTQGLICRVPARSFSGATDVVVKLVRTVSPSDMGQGDDARQLGLAVTGYKVFDA